MAFERLVPTFEQTSPLGGYVPNAMNALSKQAFENQISSAKAKYAPLTEQADALSKIAYASLVGPQYVAKLFGNTGILANIPDNQKRQAIDILTNAGLGQGSASNLQNNLMNSVANGSNNENNTLSKPLMSRLMSMLDKNNNSDQTNANDKSNAFLAQHPELSQTDQNAVRNMNPGDSYVVGSNQNPLSSGNQSGYSPAQNNNSFAENEANYKGIVEEGKESGKIRSNDIKDLNTSVFNGQTKQATLDTLSDILSSPGFEQIRQLPLLGHHELSYYSKLGTSEQQKLVGQYYTLTGNIIKDSARDFAGQFRRGEQQLLYGMKPSPSDTVDTARGKTEALSYMNKLLTERSRLTSEIMSKNHFNKLAAEEIADKQVNGNAIRQEIHDRLNPTITIRNKKTGETKTVPVSHARKLGVSNV